MASPNANYDELATTTIERRSKIVADNFSKETALLFMLKKKGNIELVSGGRTIIEELGFAGPGNAQMYSGATMLDISQGQMLTSAEFSWKQAAVAIVMTGLEYDVQNAGPEQFINLFSARGKLAEQELINKLSDATDGIYSNGTGSSGLGIGGLQLLVSDDGTGTVGNIDSSTNTFWQSQVYDFSTNGVTPGPDTITRAMNSLWLDCTVNRNHPNLIVADNTFFGYFEESLQAIQRTMKDDEMVKAGFSNYAYKNVPVVPDGAMNGSAPASHMYFLNTDYLKWKPHTKRNMVPLNPMRHAVNQDAFVKLIGFAGALTCCGRRYQGAIVA